MRQPSKGSINQSINQESKKVFLSQRNKGEKSSLQSRQVVALRAKCEQILARSAQNPCLSVHSIVLPCSSVIKTLSCLLDRGELTVVSCTAENIPSPQRPNRHPAGGSFVSAPGIKSL